MTGQSGETVRAWIDDMIETIQATPNLPNKPDSKANASNAHGDFDNDAEVFANVALGAFMADHFMEG